MCLIFFAWKSHPKYKLILVANRDEFYRRSTAEARYWNDQPIFGGRDLEAGGTWLGIRKDHGFATLTNHRNPQLTRQDALSRGKLVTGYLNSSSNDPLAYLKSIENPENYNPFNLLIGNSNSIYYFNNIEKEIRPLPSGVYGLSNAFLNSSWPKVDTGRSELTALISQEHITNEDLVGIMMRTELADDALLPHTGVSYDWEKKLSARFIEMDEYGTRCTTVLLLDYDNTLSFEEITHGKGQDLHHQVTEKFRL